MEEVEMATIDLNPEETLKPAQVDYKDLTKQDLIRLCEEKDSHIEAYESERQSVQEAHDKEVHGISEYYAKKITELSKVIKYYERKKKLILDILTLEEDKEEKK
jgi:hypothetical protein